VALELIRQLITMSEPLHTRDAARLDERDFLRAFGLISLSARREGRRARSV